MRFGHMNLVKLGMVSAIALSVPAYAQEEPGAVHGQRFF